MGADGQALQDIAELRNPYTFAIDNVTGRILINDVGASGWEEVNSGQVGTPGLNYGWATCEGFCNSGFTNPVVAFPHPFSQAVTGGVFYRGAALASAYEGHYLFADYLQGWMYRLTPDNRVYEFLTGLDSPLDIAVAPDGKLYHISYISNKIVELVYTGTGNRVPTAVATGVPSSGFAALAVTFDASGSSDPDLDALSHEWDFGDGSPVSNLQSVVHSYTSNGTFTATLTVDDGNGGSDTDTVVITVGSTPPTATIDLPLVASTYSGGDTIAYSGTATDPEDGPLGASAFRWTIQFWHDDGFAHFHPYLGPIDAVTSGTFDAAAGGETSPNVWYRVILEVTDSSGLTDTTFVDVSPITAQVTLDTAPTGLDVILDGATQTAPHVFTGVAGITRNIGTTTPQTPAATTYTFLGWSDAGALSHDITTPSVDTTFTASFTSAPVAQALALNVNEDSFIDVTLSALDGETCELAFSIVTGPANGVLGAITDQACTSGSPNTDTATVTYTPNPDFTGADSFTYMANDGIENSAVATVDLTIDPVNDPPAAANDAYSPNQDETLNVSQPAGVLANDTDIDGDPLTAALGTDVTNGTLALAAGGSFSYTPDPGYFGPDSFTYTAADATAASAPATVSLTVNGRPLSPDDAYAVDEDVVLNVAAPGVLSNDTDPELSALSAVLDTDVSSGTLVLASDGSFTYTPNPDFNGVDSFTYFANDGSANSLVAGTVTMTVNPDVDFGLTPSVTTAVFDPLSITTFTLDIVVGASSEQPVDAAQVVLIFDPAVLQVVSIDDGAIFLTDWTDASLPGTGFDNVAGTAAYLGGKGLSGTEATSSFVLATITFDTVGSSAGTSITFDEVTPPATKAFYNAADVTGDLAALVLTVTRPPVANDQNVGTSEDAPLLFTLDASDPDLDPLTYEFLTEPVNGVRTGAGPNVTYTPNPDFFGSDSFTYRVNDGTVNSQTATVTIDVTAVNDAPVAAADGYGVSEGGTLVVDDLTGVLANDSDVEGDSLTASLVADVSNGTLALAADGSFTYTHDGSETTSDSFTYTANDGLLGSNIGTVTITVNPVNDAPAAADDGYALNEGDALVVDSLSGVLANDLDAESDPLTAVLVADVVNGTLVLNPDGSFTYTHDGSETTSDSFTYMANDGLLNSNVATVTLTVNPVNDAPAAVDDGYSVDEDNVLVVDALSGVLENDSDAEGDPMTASLVADVSNGTLALASDGSFTYTPNQDFNGNDSFTYTANDGLANSNVATVSITVNPVNDAPPDAGDDAYGVDEDNTLVVDSLSGVLANDSDFDGDAMTANLVVDVANGALSLAADGSFTYTPDADFNGVDSFTYVANDGFADSLPATVTITVNAVNDAPVAMDDGYSVDEDNVLVVDALSGVLANDSDAEGDPLTANLVADVANGTLALAADGSFTYTPNANFNGVDGFTYTARDPSLADSNVATVTITVTSINDVPVAVDDGYATTEDVALVIAATGVLANDSDADGDPLTANLVADVANGTLALAADGSFTYTPDADFNGVDSFTYVANDGFADSLPATVTITVNAVNDAPVAMDDGYSVDEDNVLVVDALSGVLANDSDAESDPLTANLVADVANGTLALAADGSFTYTPNANFNGVDSFTYTARDPSLADSNVATVTITVTSINDVPVAVDDGYATTEDVALVIAATGVLANDSDADGDPLTADLVADVANGTLALAADGSFTYTPDADFNGVDSFTYTARDPSLADSNVATVTITVNAINDAPALGAIADDTVEALQSLTVNISASDVDGDALTLSAPGLPAFGALTDNGDGTGSIDFTPTIADGGSHVINVEVSDGLLLASASFTLTVDATVSITFELTLQGRDTPAAWVGGHAGRYHGGDHAVRRPAGRGQSPGLPDTPHDIAQPDVL